MSSEPGLVYWERRRLIARDPYVWSWSDLPGSLENDGRKLDIVCWQYLTMILLLYICHHLNTHCMSPDRLVSLVFPCVLIYNVWKEWVNAFRHQTNIQMDRQTNRQTERQTDRQSDRQTDNRFLGQGFPSYNPSYNVDTEMNRKHLDSSPIIAHLNHLESFENIPIIAHNRLLSPPLSLLRALTSPMWC